MVAFSLRNKKDFWRYKTFFSRGGRSTPLCCWASSNTFALRPLKKTTCPNMRFCWKVDGKFIDFSKKELIQQIKDVVLPECSVEDLGSLLDTILEFEVTDVWEGKISGFWWQWICRDTDWKFRVVQNPLDEVRLGVLVVKTRYGYQPRPETVDRNGWNLIERVEDYCYVERPSGIYLVY